MFTVRHQDVTVGHFRKLIPDLPHNGDSTVFEDRLKRHDLTFMGCDADLSEWLKEHAPPPDEVQVIEGRVYTTGEDRGPALDFDVVAGGATWRFTKWCVRALNAGGGSPRTTASSPPTTEVTWWPGGGYSVRCVRQGDKRP